MGKSAKFENEVVDLADELRESFINGNRGHVVQELAAKPPLEAAVLVAFIVAKLPRVDRESFQRALLYRLDK